MKRVRARRFPLAFAALALLIGLAWSVATAPLDGPDEAGHVAYVQLLAETGDGPQRDRGTPTGVGQYSTQIGRLLVEGNLGPIISHVEGLPSFSGLASLNAQLEHVPSEQRTNGAGPNPIAANPPFYYALLALPYKLSPSARPLNRLFVLRLANVALFVLTAVLMWLLSAELFGAAWQRVCATGLVVLQPKLGSLAGAVNPDTLLVTMTTAFVLVSMRIVRRGPTLRRSLTLGATVAVAVATHGRGFALLGALPVVAAIGLWPLRRDIRRLALLLVAILVPVIAAAALGVLWTRSHGGGGAFGGEITAATRSGGSLRQFLSYVYQFYFNPLSFMSPLGPPYGYRQVYIESGFGLFGSLEVTYPLWVYDMIQLAVATGAAALGAAILLRWEVVRREWRTAAVVLTTAVATVGLLHVASYRALAAGSVDPLFTGRYLLPLVPLAALTITWVISTLSRRLAPWLAGWLLSFSLALTIAGLGLTAWRFGA